MWMRWEKLRARRIRTRDDQNCEIVSVIVDEEYEVRSRRFPRVRVRDEVPFPVRLWFRSSGTEQACLCS